MYICGNKLIKAPHELKSFLNKSTPQTNAKGMASAKNE